MHRLLAHRLLTLVLTMCCAPGTWSAPFDTLRAQEIAECRPEEIATWGDGVDRPALATSLVFAYSHAAAPAWFAQPAVLAALERAASAWSACGIPATVRVLAPGEQAAPQAIPVRWSDEGSQRNFGAANLSLKALFLGPAAFQLLQTRNPGFDAHTTLQMVISHEMGHFFGVVAHSRRCVDVSSYYHNAQGEQCRVRGGNTHPPGVEYRATLPTACDIQRCKAANR